MKRYIYIIGLFFFSVNLSSQVTFEEKCNEGLEINFKDSLAVCADAINDLVIDCDSSVVWFVSEPTNGVNYIEWEDDPHDDPSNIWTGVQGQGGLPSHYPSTITDSGITNDWTYSTSANHLQMWSSINTIGLGPIIVEDNNQNTGERILPFVSLCKSNFFTLEELTTDTPASDRGYGEFGIVFEEGIHCIGWLASDLSANQGVNLRYTTDLTGATGWTNFPDDRTYVDKPKATCKTVSCDYVLAEGESYNKIELCEYQPAIIGGGNSEPEPPTLEIERCTGIFENSNGRSGNRFTRPTSTTNLGWEYTDWARVGNQIITSPDCQTDLQIVANLGERYFQNDNSCIYTYFDTRLLINGAVVQTRVADSYEYECNWDDRNNINLDDIGTVTFHRDNVPAGSTVEVQFRMRSLYTGLTNPSPFAQIVWGGIRSEASFSFNPDYEVMDITASRVIEQYWYREEDFAYSYGKGEAPEDAKVVGSQVALDNNIRRLENALDEELEKLFEIK